MNSLDPGDRVLVIEQSFIGHIEEINQFLKILLYSLLIL